MGRNDRQTMHIAVSVCGVNNDIDWIETTRNESDDSYMARQRYLQTNIVNASPSKSRASCQPFNILVRTLNPKVIMDLSSGASKPATNGRAKTSRCVDV